MADKNEFLAQDELITIIPNFKRENPLHLLSGDFGPFEPLTPISVPLWLALTLKKRKNCKIQIPVWMYAGLKFSFSLSKLILSLQKKKKIV